MCNEPYTLRTKGIKYSGRVKPFLRLIKLVHKICIEEKIIHKLVHNPVEVSKFPFMHPNSTLNLHSKFLERFGTDRYFLSPSECSFVSRIINYSITLLNNLPEFLYSFSFS